MKKLYSFSLLAFLTAPAIAQSVQQVQILEYRGKEEKTPVIGATLSVTNASAAMSDAEGKLTLSFRTLHAGDPVQIRRIEKPGYEIFNLEAVEQWAISPNATFQLIVCSSERMRQLCDTYSEVASQSYQRQMQEEKKRLESERKSGRLKEEEYKEELLKLEDFYAQQLENLDLYVERFAHFDLSELNAEEQEIIELVQKGEIDNAFLRYEQMDLLGKYQKQSQEIKAIQTTQDSLQVIREEKVIARDSIKSTIDFMEDIKKRQ